MVQIEMVKLWMWHGSVTTAWHM